MDIRNALEAMRRDFGPEIFRSPTRMTAVLRDLAPGLEGECNTLRQLAERGLLSELEQASREDDAQRGRAVMKLRACLTDYLQLSGERTEYYVALLLDFYGLPPDLANVQLRTGHQGTVTWTLDERGLLTVSGAGPMQDYQFADEAVNCPWWERREEIVSVSVEEGLTSVGNSAFYGCHALETVTLAESVERIGEWAFADCARLDGLRLPQSLRRIDRGAFSDCNALSAVAIPDGVSVIESWTFRHCPRLRRVDIPDSVVRIGERAFEGCTLLSRVQIPAITRTDESAFDSAVVLTRRLPPDDEPSPAPAPVGLSLYFSPAVCRKFPLVLFALAVLLRNGLWTLPLLLIPAALILFLEGP